MKLKTTISILGCGWLGLALGKQLVREGYIVKGSTQTVQKLSILHQHKITPFLIGVQKKIKGTNLSQFFQSDILILNIPPGRKRKDVEKAYPKQIAAIIQQVAIHGIKKVLFASSTSIYGNVNRIVTEADEPKPETSTGKALVRAEYLFMQNETFETSILRLGGLVGNGREAGRFLAGKKDLKNGFAPVNLVHRDDCIAIISKIIADNYWGQIFNVCADEHPTRHKFYTQQARKQGLEPPTFLLEEAYFFKKVSNYKVKQALSYEFLNPDPMKF